jgi:hypothetical protein
MDSHKGPTLWRWHSSTGGGDVGYYMQGDYYGVGDYYRVGDPGLFSSIFSGLKGAVGGFLKGGPLGAVSGAIGGISKAKSSSGLPTFPMLPPAPTGLPGAIGIKVGGMQINPLAAMPGGAPLVSAAGGAKGPTGYHLDKKTHSKWVRNRRMNPANPRALRRSIRREKGFVALAKRVLRGTGMSIHRTGMARKATRRRR